MAASKKDVVILVVIAALSGLLLSGTYLLTKHDILEAEKRLQKEALQKVMPFMTQGQYNQVLYEYEGKTLKIFTVNEDGEYKGSALELVTKEGYGGTIVFYLGVDPDAKVTGLFITKTTETPGLGAKASDEAWWGQFVGKSKDNFIFKVEKDKGDVVAITASTITSRAISNAIDAGLDVYKSFLENGKTSNVKDENNGQK